MAHVEAQRRGDVSRAAGALEITQMREGATMSLPSLRAVALSREPIVPATNA